MSYDDGTMSDRRLVSIFNKYGIKGSFHLNAGLADKDDIRIPLSEVKKLYIGHEVSGHTYTHPTIARCPLSLVIEQILKDRAKLEKTCGYAVRVLSFPNRSVSSDIVDLLPHCGIEYARTGNSTGSFAMPDNFLLWNPTCHHNQNLIELGKEFITLYKPWYLYMMYVWGHSYEFDNDNNWELMEKFCETVGGRDDIWYATNIEIVDYMNAAKNLKYTVDMDKVYNPSAIPVWINVDGQIHKIKQGETIDI
jgi:peptidoglycan/xylan/chitin deacetylase (PgdA/CDA1 family)